MKNKNIKWVKGPEGEYYITAKNPNKPVVYTTPWFNFEGKSINKKRFNDLLPQP